MSALVPGCVKKAKTLDRDRTSCSFKAAFGAHTQADSSLKTEPENFILVALRLFEFSHSLDPYPAVLPVATSAANGWFEDFRQQFPAIIIRMRPTLWAAAVRPRSGATTGNCCGSEGSIRRVVL